MGSAIAAHLAGAGISVLLLDIVPPALSGAQLKEPRARNQFALQGVEKALSAKPPLFFEPDVARLIEVGNLEDDLAKLSNCELVIEAVVEDLAVKQKLFGTLAPHLSESCILASNTSGLSLGKMNQVLPEELRSRFVVMHFFNPVRYMRLVEVVAGPDTDPEVVARVARFGEFLGKGIVYGKDTTNFVANRIGVYSMMLATHEMLAQGLSIEAVDEIAGKPMGRPASAVFKTSDIVGIDTMIHVARNCYDSLGTDSERQIFEMPSFIQDLAKRGDLGRKTGAGFYKKQGNDILVLDLKSAEYRPPVPVVFDGLTLAKKAKGTGARIAQLVASEDAAGRFAWRILAKTLCYAAGLVGEIADDIVNIDRAMRWGFNWELGPFEVWDALGVAASVERMQADGMNVPSWVTAMLSTGRSSFYVASEGDVTFYDPARRAGSALTTHEKHLTVASYKAQSKNVVRTNAGASLVHIGDGVLCVELHTKMNTLDPDVVAMLNEAVDIAESSFEAIVIANDSEHFSAGANLQMIVGAAMAGQWDKVDGIISGLQNALQRLKYASVPVVSTPCQYTLGGGCELAMAADCSQAYAEAYMGLVEVGVGLLPAGGGCLRMADRYTSEVSDVEGVDLLPFVAQASLNIALAKTSGSAAEARALRYLRPTDRVALNREFLLFEAKQTALGMASSGYRPPRPLLLRAAGYDAARTIGAKIWGMVEGRFASKHDALIANKIAHVLCGGTVAAGTVLPEQHFLDLEREAFLQLCGEKKTHERIEHMLTTGKPLRN
jgi:3-hydroxyacyl-CoA dehydrogenase